MLLQNWLVSLFFRSAGAHAVPKTTAAADTISEDAEEAGMGEKETLIYDVHKEGCRWVEKCLNFDEFYYVQGEKGVKRSKN